MKNNIITHLSVYEIDAAGVFDTVNNYQEMNDTMISYARNNGIEDTNSTEWENSYANRFGAAFEVYTQFFGNRFGHETLLGIFKITDTSDAPSTYGYDFLFTGSKKLGGKKGMLQSKARSNPLYSFKIGELSTMGDIANALEIEKNNCILFINFDDHDNLFDYRYKFARNGKRIVDRSAQEFFINRDPDFWNDFRTAIKESSKVTFKVPPSFRETQTWISNGHEKEGVNYPGTVAVLDGTLTKGRVQAECGAGKTLNEFDNIMKAFNVYNKNIVVAIIPSLALIDQIFNEFYQWGMFTDIQNKCRSNISCFIIRSGSNPRFNEFLADVEQNLNPDVAVDFIEQRIQADRKVLIFITMDSHKSKYDKIVENISEKNMRIGLEVVDEYHNIISDGSLEEQEVKAEYLRNNISRSDGTIFYSASNKDGKILSSADESLFGPLLAKVTRSDLQKRAIVRPKIRIRFIAVKSVSPGMEIRRVSERVGLDIDAAQIEAVGTILAFKDACRIYTMPNLLTFGDHVEGCRHISTDAVMEGHLPGVKQHFIAAEISASDRVRIFDEVRSSGNNIIHQHSCAKEGVNIQNLSGVVIDRGTDTKTAQQAIGRSDRANPIDTEKFEKGELKLDDPTGWINYYNNVYVILDSDDTANLERIKTLVNFLEGSGIPREEWDMNMIKIQRGGKQMKDKFGFAPTVLFDIAFDENKIKMMMEKSITQMDEDNAAAEIKNESLKTSIKTLFDE